MGGEFENFSLRRGYFISQIATNMNSPELQITRDQVLRTRLSDLKIDLVKDIEKLRSIRFAPSSTATAGQRQRSAGGG